MIEIVFETHSTSVDNERQIASGWSDCLLSDLGREQAKALGERRRNDGVDAVFTSDLRRAVATATIAFGGTAIPVFHDWRLRECDYGDLNATSSVQLKAHLPAHVDTPYPGGESWRQATARVARVLDDLPLRWDGKRLVIIGHMATRWALEHLLNGMTVEDLAAEEFVWQEGWEYRLPT